MVPLAALLYDPSPALAAGVAPDLGGAQSFAVLGAETVTNKGPTIVTGDLGVSPGTAVTGFPPGIVIGGTIHAGDAVAAQAHSDAVIAYNALVAQACDFNYSDVQELGGRVLTPGVHCFPSSAQLTGTLTLIGSGPFIFKIGTTLTTASNSSVLVLNGGQTCNGSNVFWAVGSSATLGTGTQFVGNILALISITLNTGASVSGSALALTGAVTMDTNNVSVCTGPGGTFPPAGAIKVTGGGQIPVPKPDSNVSSDTGSGRATFGFNAQPNKSGGGAKGHFNYLNHVTGLHVNGPVTDIQVIAINLDGSPKTVRFSGTCDGNLPACSFSVTVQDNGEPGRIDTFGITVTGALSEVRSQRIISRGNIQFHK